MSFVIPGQMLRHVLRVSKVAYYSTGRIELMIDNHLTLELGIHKTLTSAVCFDSESKGCLFNNKALQL